jgi:tetratricopeptide (TPR) repeat protein
MLIQNQYFCRRETIMKTSKQGLWLLGLSSLLLTCWSCATPWHAPQAAPSPFALESSDAPPEKLAPRSGEQAGSNVAATLTSGDFDANFALTMGKIQLEQKNYRQAYDYFEKGLQKYPENPFFYEYLGHTYLFFGKGREAANYYQKAFSHDPSYAQTPLKQIVIEITKNDMGAAKQLAEIFALRQIAKSPGGGSQENGHSSEAAKARLRQGEESEVASSTENISDRNVDPADSSNLTTADESTAAPGFQPAVGKWDDFQRQDAQKYGWNIYETEHYQVQTNIAQKMVEEVGEFLEQTLTLYKDRFWDLLMSKAPDQHTVKIFKNEADFLRYSPEKRGSGGYYDWQKRELVLFLPPGLYGKSLKQPGFLAGQQFRHVLTHEGWHQFFHDTVRAKTSIPIWMDEGYAEYFSCAEVIKTPEGDKFLLGQICEWDLSLIQQIIKAGRQIPLKQFIFMSQAEFMTYPKITYPQAWSLVYFLSLNQSDPKYRALYFPKYELSSRYDSLLTDIFRRIQESNNIHGILSKLLARLDIAELEQEWQNFYLNEIQIFQN